MNQISKISLLLQNFRALWNSSEMKLLFSFHQILKTLNSKQEMYLFVWILFLPDTRVVCFKEGNCLQLNKGEPQNIILIKFLDWKEDWNLKDIRGRTKNDELELFCSSLLRNQFWHASLSSKNRIFIIVPYLWGFARGKYQCSNYHYRTPRTVLARKLTEQAGLFDSNSHLRRSTFLWI